jgi:hypothetical protein
MRYSSQSNGVCRLIADVILCEQKPLIGTGDAYKKDRGIAVLGAWPSTLFDKQKGKATQQ